MQLNQIYMQQRQHVTAKRQSNMAYHFPVTIHFTGKNFWSRFNRTRKLTLKWLHLNSHRSLHLMQPDPAWTRDHKHSCVSIIVLGKNINIFFILSTVLKYVGILWPYSSATLGLMIPKSDNILEYVCWEWCRSNSNIHTPSHNHNQCSVHNTLLV